MKLTPEKGLIGLVVIALLLTFWPERSELKPGQSPVVTGMDAPPDTVLLRILAKRQIALDVANGRRLLVEAAVLFRELNRLSPAATDLTLADRYLSALRAPVGSDEERLCRQVVVGVDCVMQKEGTLAWAEEAVARLEAEFRAAPRTHGVIQLPDASALTPVQELLNAARAWRAAFEPPPIPN